MSTKFEQRLKALEHANRQLVVQQNVKSEPGNGIFDRYERPVLTAMHTPMFWRYDLNRETNPHLMERFTINAVFNSGAIKFRDKYILVARVEGADRKSFFAIA